MKLRPSTKDLTGQTFGQLTATSFAGYINRHAVWNCICACGNKKPTAARHMLSGATQSCGCLNLENIKSRSTTHGLSKSSMYRVYRAMWDRCMNKDNKGFSSYGGRGVKICERWLNNPQAFVDDMGPKPSPKHSVERIDNDGDYSPDNCRWATQTEQARNTRNNRLLTYRGVRLPMATWSDIFGINQVAVSKRLNRGWDIAKALETPLMVNQWREKNDRV